MTYPNVYRPEKVGSAIVPNIAEAVHAGHQSRLAPASEDATRTLLLLVDIQIDFVHEDGSLAVPGAIDDTRRTIAWIYRNASRITTIAASLDSHQPRQIFFPTWWVDASGQQPAPFTPITSEDITSGRWQPVYAPEWSTSYVAALEAQAKKTLMIWPFHTMLGTAGHNLVPGLYEAIVYHAAARHTQPEFLTKGLIPETENYSIFEPEVKIPTLDEGTINTAFLDELATYDRIFITGQAKSHCVLETISTLMRYFANRPDIISKLHLLDDCTSSVFHPDIDFDALAEDTLAEFSKQGLSRAQSTEPLA